MCLAPWRIPDARFEQAVYGSFPFWSRGYAILAQSAGCRDDWLNALKRAAQSFGEPPPGTVDRPCLFATPLGKGAWMIVGVFPQGCDDQGRPGALAFHGLFVGKWSYLRAGTNPFAFVPALRGEWTAHDCDLTLPGGSLSLRWRPDTPDEATGAQSSTIIMVVDLLKRGRKVICRSDEPIDRLARGVWKKLPRSLRRKTSMATWAYCNLNQFDLLGVPRILAADRDGTHQIFELDEEPPRTGPEGSKSISASQRGCRDASS